MQPSNERAHLLARSCLSLTVSILLGNSVPEAKYLETSELLSSLCEIEALSVDWAIRGSSHYTISGSTTMLVL